MADIAAVGATVVTTTVVGLQGRPVAAIAPTINQVLMWNGTQWVPGTITGGTTPPSGTTGVVGGGGAPVVGGGGAPVVGGGTVAVLIAQIAELEARIAALEGKS